MVELNELVCAATAGDRDDDLGTATRGNVLNRPRERVSALALNRVRAAQGGVGIEVDRQKNVPQRVGVRRGVEIGCEGQGLLKACPRRNDGVSGGKLMVRDGVGYDDGAPHLVS